MGKGRVQVSYGLLASLRGLCFPEGTEIEAVLDKACEAVFEIVLSHPDLPEVAEDALMPSYTPKLGNELVDGKHYEVRFLGWGDAYYPSPIIEDFDTTVARINQLLTDPKNRERLNAAFRENRGQDD